MTASMRAEGTFLRCFGVLVPPGTEDVEETVIPVDGPLSVVTTVHTTALRARVGLSL